MPSAAPATSGTVEPGPDEGGSGLPSSSDLGLPSGPQLADTELVAAHEVGGNIDLYVVDGVTGETQERLTSDAATDYIPVIAPDRTSVVYLREAGGGVDLWVVATDGQGARPLFADTPPGCETIWRPAWNPADPTMLAALCVDAAGTSTLQLLTPWGGRISTLDAGFPRFDDLSFSPDGASLIYWASADPGASDGALFMLPTDGSSPPVQLTDPAVTGAADGIWSPDGTRIVFRARVDDSGTQTNTEIFVVDADGGNATPLAPAPGIDQDPAWSPDGSMIAFKSDRADADGLRVDRLWIMNADGTNSRLLTPGSVVDGFPPAWSNR